MDFIYFDNSIWFSLCNWNSMFCCFSGKKYHKPQAKSNSPQSNLTSRKSRHKINQK